MARALLVDHAVLEFCQFAGIPAVRGAHQIAGDALQGVNVVTMAVRAFLEVLFGILKAAVQGTARCFPPWPAIITPPAAPRKPGNGSRKWPISIRKAFSTRSRTWNILTFQPIGGLLCTKTEPYAGFHLHAERLDGADGTRLVGRAEVIADAGIHIQAHRGSETEFYAQATCGRPLDVVAPLVIMDVLGRGVN